MDSNSQKQELEDISKPFPTHDQKQEAEDNKSKRKMFHNIFYFFSAFLILYLGAIVFYSTPEKRIDNLKEFFQQAFPAIMTLLSTSFSSYFNSSKS